MSFLPVYPEVEVPRDSMMVTHTATTPVTCSLLALWLWGCLWRKCSCTAFCNHKPLALLHVTVNVTCSISKPLVAAHWAGAQEHSCVKQGQGISPQCLLLFAVRLL